MDWDDDSYNESDVSDLEDESYNENEENSHELQHSSHSSSDSVDSNSTSNPKHPQHTPFGMPKDIKGNIIMHAKHHNIDNVISNNYSRLSNFQFKMTCSPNGFITIHSDDFLTQKRLIIITSHKINPCIKRQRECDSKEYCRH